MQFIDEALVHVKAGDGGNGSAAFRREDGVPRGGPSGGDGGNGGSVIVVADGHLASLLDYKYKRHYKAERGEDGRNKDQYGAAGGDLTLKVPVGTVIYDADTDEPLADLDTDGATFVLARGGIGGKGNIHFKTPWNQAPRTAEPGTPGEERTVRLELKLLADVGLLGFPNAGKSTFISAVSRARPKIADYPFTTLEPHLGVVNLGDFRTFVIADIPGLIEGAHTGAGLGDRFLRHIERTKLLLHLVDVSSVSGRDAVSDYETVNHELASYNQDLAARPQFVVATKIDALDEPERLESLKQKAERDEKPFFAISSATGAGVRELVNAMAAKLEEL